MKKPTHKSNMLHLAKARFHAAFSLVELLVVIAVIGLIAAIAIPNIANITGQATAGSVQRNAQNVASTWSAARAAGYSASGITTQAGAVDAIVAGVTGQGDFSTSTFKVPLGATEVTAVKAYTGLGYDTTSNMLEYEKE